MKPVISVLIFIALHSSSALSASKQEQYEKFVKQMNKLLSEEHNANSKEIKNTHTNKNTKVTFTSCEGKAVNPSVLIMPDTYPAKYKLRHVTFKFSINHHASPENIKIIEGDEELASLSQRSLQRSQFEKKYATCWLAKYECNDSRPDSQDLQ